MVDSVNGDCKFKVHLCHYNIVEIPARVRKPRDKSLAEYAVQLVERWITAKHGDDVYFSFHELNRMVKTELDAANNRPFAKMDGSRRSVFEATEKQALKPLPLRPYEYAEFKQARVAPDMPSRGTWAGSSADNIKNPLRRSLNCPAPGSP